MLRFFAPEPSRKLTESQQQFARRILLGIEGEFVMPDDIKNTAQEREKTRCADAPISPSAHPSRRSGSMATEPIRFRLFTTVEIEVEPDVLDDSYRVIGRYDGGILFESTVPDETVREWQQILCDATSRFDAIAAHVDAHDADTERAEALARIEAKIKGMSEAEKVATLTFVQSEIEALSEGGDS